MNRVQIRSDNRTERRAPVRTSESHSMESAFRSSGPAPARETPVSPVQVIRSAPKVGRNDPCPCGSGKKYKNCHGRNMNNG